MGKANWIGHILHKNYLLKQVTKGKIEGRIEVIGRRGKRRKQLLDDLKLKYSVLETERGITLCRIHFGSGYGPVVRENK